MASTVTQADKIQELQDEIDQHKAEKDLLTQRARELGSYEQEVRALREGNASLQAQLTQAEQDRDAAQKAANIAAADATSANQRADAAAEQVAAAQAVADAVKALSGGK